MLSVVLATVSMASPVPPLAVSFSPAGLLFPYYVGVGYELRRQGIITEGTPIGGSSAGSIVSTALACGVSEEAVLDGLKELVADVRAGTRLNVALRSQLDILLDDDSPATAEAHALKICYFEVLPRPGGRLVTSWASKQDLIDTVCASCAWPFFFSPWPFVLCRRSLTLDGFFGVPRERFGCPPFEAERCLAITALPKVSLPAFSCADLIQAGSTGLQELPVGEAQWFSWALEPAPDENLEAMVELGRAHARSWASKQEGGSAAM